MKMKGIRAVVLIVALMAILSCSSFCDARPLQQETTRNRGKGGMVIGMSNSEMMMMMKDQTTSAGQEEAVFSHMMGAMELDGGDGEDEEGCGKGEGNSEDEEECRMKRRMMAEAHLDYIYTQHHSHP
ncbi:hypothetical protein MLD38_035461 [Melastoma candidum]|uniref:Uncharacterized protein n=1 Tax=Melastoma candidum TaxID=119954 RepID=A0ACB9LGQ6_9MYRT|nr:hypothetical protein MLD38_035461 [Melastoma candidum]